MKNKIFFLGIVVVYLTGHLPAQEKAQAAASEKAQTTDSEWKNLTPDFRLVLSSSNYQVTAGDVYTLTYAVGTTPVIYTIMVDRSYRVRISDMGTLSVAGKTYRQLKAEAETIVSKNYPLSGVQLVLTQPGLFRVYVKGEVEETQEVTTWGMARLSSLVEYMTPYGSKRDVEIRSVNGEVKSYDLFKVERYGEKEQDPYLRPDDEITFKRAARQVTLTGAVERPETYQMLAGENLKELIEVYGNGFTPLADPTRIEVTRYVNSASVSGNKILPGETMGGYKEDFQLEHYDEVMVPEKTLLRPVVFVEGAVEAISEQEREKVSAVPTTSNRLVIPFNKGEYYGTLVRRNSKWFSAVSDTRNAYIIRGEEHIPINLNPMLYDEGYRGEEKIRENDTLIIPFRQYFVTVAGAVVNPGRYPYIPDRGWEYYIALAGGFVPERNRGESITMADIQGRRMAKTDRIMPETVITAKTNHGLYYFMQYAPVITTVLSIVGTTLSILALVNQ